MASQGRLTSWSTGVIDPGNGSSLFPAIDGGQARMSISGDAKLLTEEVTDWVENVLNLLMLAICLVAVVTNVINLQVFYRQGVLSNSVTLCLFSLATSDLLGAACLIPHNCCRIVRLHKDRFSFTSCNTITLLTSTALHTVFFNISCWVTVYMSVERSLCVLMPLKVKQLLKPKTTAVSLAVICLFFISTHTFVSSHLKIGWQKVPGLNKSFAIPYKSPYAAKVLHLGSILLFTCLITLAMGIVLVATFLMLHQLNKSRKWRQSTMPAKTDVSDKAEETGAGTGEKRQRRRDMEVVKTVTTVTSIFLVCLSVGFVPSLGVQAVTTLTHSGTNMNFMSMLSTIKYFFDAVNECVNFFFYVRVSSRYKATFSTLYPRWFKDAS